MIQLSVDINRPVSKVWAYFTTPNNWIHWYGGTQEVGVDNVDPRWEEGAKIVWSTGAESDITNIIPGTELTISGGWTEVTFRFKAKGETTTVVELLETDPVGASYADGGAASKANWATALRKLKERIEKEN